MGKRKPIQPVKDPRQTDIEDWLEEKLTPETEKLTPKLAWFELCKLRAEGDKLRAEGNKLRAEGDKLHAEGRLIFSQTVIDHHGPKTTTRWTSAGFRVADREYKYEEPI